MRCPAEAFGRSEAFGMVPGTVREMPPAIFLAAHGGPRKCSRQRVLSKAFGKFCDVDRGVAFTWTRIWSKNSRSLWNERNFSAQVSTFLNAAENLLISLLARAPPPPPPPPPRCSPFQSFPQRGRPCWRHRAQRCTPAGTQ